MRGGGIRVLCLGQAKGVQLVAEFLLVTVLWVRAKGGQDIGYIMVGEKSVFCTSLHPMIKDRRNKVQPILVVRGGMNGQRDPAIVYTTVASGVGGTGLPARVRVGTRLCKVRGSSIVLLRRLHAVSGEELGSGIYRLSSTVLSGIGRTLRVDLRLAF